ncbi:MAG: hypothetical protein AMXMBFR34_36520 [Myxococcaceae bacterium]
MRSWLWLLMALPVAQGCACAGGGGDDSIPLVARAELTAAAPTVELGDDCTAGGRASCRSGTCIHYGPSVATGYACARLCRGDDECPLEWACREILPGDPNRFCIPPADWTPRPTPVRPRGAATQQAAAPDVATPAAAGIDGGTSP